MRCTNCQQTLPESAFYLKEGKPMRQCKECHKEKARQHRAEHGARINARRCERRVKKPREIISKQKPCPTCGKPFVWYPSVPLRFCSVACRVEFNWTTATCPACDKEFRYKLSHPQTYCSMGCRQWPIRTLKTASCEICAVEFTFEPTSERGRFCSLKCFGRHQSLYVVGEAHPLFKGGHIDYYGPSWQEARRKARARDKVCRRCGKTPERNGKALDVHHIRPFREFGVEHHRGANALHNLICYCMPCHKWVEHYQSRP